MRHLLIDIANQTELHSLWKGTFDSFCVSSLASPMGPLHSVGLGTLLLHSGNQAVRHAGLRRISPRTEDLLLYRAACEESKALSVPSQPHLWIEPMRSLFRIFSLSQPAIESLVHKNHPFGDRFERLLAAYLQYKQSIHRSEIDSAEFLLHGIRFLPTFVTSLYGDEISISASHLERSHETPLSLYGSLLVLDVLSQPQRPVRLLLPATDGIPLWEQALAQTISGAFSFHTSHFEEGIIQDENEDIAPRSERISTQGKATLHISSSSASEHTEAAMQVKTWLEQGIPASQIAVVTPSDSVSAKMIATLERLHLAGWIQNSACATGEQTTGVLAPILATLLRLYAREETDPASPILQARLQTVAPYFPNLPIAEWVDSIPEQASIQTHATLFKEMLQKIVFPTHAATLLFQPAEPFIKTSFERWHTQHAAFMLLLEELCNVSISIDNIQIQHTLFSMLCQTLLRSSIHLQHQSIDNVVLVGDPASLSSQKLSHVCMIGLIKGAYPSPPKEDPLLPDEIRSKLNRWLGKPMFPLSRSCVDSLPFHIQALFQHARHIRCSYSLFSDHNRETFPSSLLTTYTEPIPLSMIDSATLAIADDPSLKSRVNIETSRRAFHEQTQASTRTYELGIAQSPKLVAYVGDLRGIEQLDFSKQGDEKHPISVSAIEDYARCPFLFFAKHILRLTPHVDDDESEDVSSWSIGECAHEILRRFFTERQQAHAFPIQGTEEELQQLSKIIDEYLSSQQGLTLLGNPHLVEIRIRQLKRALPALILAEAQHHPTKSLGLIPTFFEHSFVFALPDPPTSSLPVHIRGRIDRIDIGEDRAQVLDYKWGGIDFYNRILKQELGKTSLQLPLYTLSCKHTPILRNALSNRHVTAHYYSIRQRTRSEQEVTEASIDTSELHAIVSRLREGDFRIAPVTCHGCSFWDVCRIPKRRE